MAMNKAVSFDKIRVIIGVEGTKLNDQFIAKEIGYTCSNFTGSIGMNFGLQDSKKYKKLDLQKSNFLYKFHHGIDIFNNNLNWPDTFDYEAVLKTIYHLSEDKNNPDKIYIGYNNDPHIATLLHNSNLGDLAINLYNIYEDIPSMKKIKLLPYYGHGVYSQCFIHDRHTHARIQCAAVKTKILYEICLSKYKVI